MFQLYAQDSRNPNVERVLNIETEGNAPLTDKQIRDIRWILESPGVRTTKRSKLLQSHAIEVGPQLRMETGDSTRLVEICKRIGISISRAEMSKRHRVTPGTVGKEIIRRGIDPLLEQVYAGRLKSFFSTETRVPTLWFPEVTDAESLRRVNDTHKFGLKELLFEFVLTLLEGRTPSDALLALLGASLSEHTRHGTIKSPIILNGVLQPQTIIEMVQEPWRKNPGNSLVQFHDGAGVIEGHSGVPILMPMDPTRISDIVERLLDICYTITAETHSHPSYVSPVPGAETGVGGMLRDLFTQGKGALVLGMIIAGYCTGNYMMPEHKIAGEELGGVKQEGYATSLEGILGMSDGACDNANKTGVAITQGFVDSFEQVVNGRHTAWEKFICYVGGSGITDKKQIFKQPLEKGMLILRVGSATRRVGVGGATLSSEQGGTAETKLDTASVQRADAVEESAVFRGLKCFMQLGLKNPVIDLVDQGAGGLGNLFFELVGLLGGKLNLRNLRIADKTMSPREQLIAETQEAVGIVIRRKSLKLVMQVFEREGAFVEVLGKIIGNGRFVVDSVDGIVVDVAVEKALSNPPWQPIRWDDIPNELPALVLPTEYKLAELVRQVFTLPAVGSKRHLIIKGDQSVGGRIAQQQICGPLQMHVANVAVLAASFNSNVGMATARGHQGVLGLVSAEAQGRMVIGKMYTNIVGARISSLADLKCRLNEMAAPQQPGEGAKMYRGVRSSCQIMEVIRTASSGGKDSLGSAVKKALSYVVGPMQLVAYGHAPVNDIRQVVNPDAKGRGMLLYLNSQGQFRLGGSALAQSMKQLGNECPDIDFPLSFVRSLEAILALHDAGLMTALHDVGRGGLVTTLLEMFMAGNRGGCIEVGDRDVLPFLFNEEVGHVIECKPENLDKVLAILKEHGVENDAHVIGKTGTMADRHVTITSGRQTLLHEDIGTLRVWWEATATALEMRQTNRDMVLQEVARFNDPRVIRYDHTFRASAPAIIRVAKPYAAVFRAKGTNGYEEYIAALVRHGFKVVNIHMNDIFSRRVRSLKKFQFAGFPGGFADGDAGGSAKGWAASILLNDNVNAMFADFYERPDTVSFGPCNGAQLMSLIGWTPGRHVADKRQPRLVENKSGRFEGRWIPLKVMEDTDSPLLHGMGGMVLGVWSAHGEGQYVFQDEKVYADIVKNKLVPFVYVGLDGEATEAYPFNPNGSRDGVAGLLSRNKRHLATMLHMERCNLEHQMGYVPEEFKGQGAPWDRLFHNMRYLCDQS